MDGVEDILERDCVRRKESVSGLLHDSPAASLGHDGVAPLLGGGRLAKNGGARGGQVYLDAGVLDLDSVVVWGQVRVEELCFGCTYFCVVFHSFITLNPFINTLSYQ